MTDQAPGPLAGCRVLVAEDEALNSMLLEDMLLQLGADAVGFVTSVAEIIGTVEKQAWDIVTLDVNLNGEHPYDVAAVLRQRGTPFVFVSGYDVLPRCPVDLQNAPRVRKPFRVNELAAALEEALHRRPREKL